MIHPIPSGTRDVLPDETRELRAITETVRRVFEESGYGEVSTPALEYEAVLSRADLSGARPAYRLFDEHGEVLVLRSDMTIPIARVVATRYPHSEPPLRFCYFAHCYRSVRPQRGHAREMLQAGIELVGSPAPHGTAEVLSMICRALDATGLAHYRIGLGDASLYSSLLTGLGVAPEMHDRLLHFLVVRDFVGLEQEVRALGVDESSVEVLLRVPQTRGDPSILEGLPGPLHDAVAGLRSVHELLDPPVAERVIFDLGLLRELGYYTGAVFEIYDPAVGMPIGGGGRYDELLGRFGRPLPAVGFALVVDQLHLALAGEERQPGWSRRPRARDSANEEDFPEGQGAPEDQRAPEAQGAREGQGVPGGQGAREGQRVPEAPAAVTERQS